MQFILYISECYTLVAYTTVIVGRHPAIIQL